MALLSTQKISGGLQPTYTAAAAAGDKFTTNGRTALLVKNGGAGAINVTIPKVRSLVEVPEYGELAVSDLTLQIAAGESGILAPAPGAYASGGQVEVNYDDVTSVTVAVVELPRV